MRNNLQANELHRQNKSHSELIKRKSNVILILCKKTIPPIKMHQTLKARDEEVQNTKKGAHIHSNAKLLSQQFPGWSRLEERVPETLSEVFKLKIIFIIMLNCYLPF